MTLLAFAPLAYVLVSDGKLTLAVLCWLGIQTIEPLPDQDFRLPVLDHRGASHSLLAVLVVGSLIGGGGWVLGDRLFDVLYGVFSTGGHLWSRLLAVLPNTSAYVLSGLAPSITSGEIVATIQEQAGGSVGRRGFAMFGFAVGAGGVLAHLFGDVITTQGIKPFVPFSGWRLSLSSLRADSPVANSGLFGLGVLAIVVVLVATVPGAVLGVGMPAALSPVDVAAGQSPTQTTNQTTTQTQNATSTNATVAFSNQTTNGSVVTVKRATLPEGGFVVLSNDPYGEIGLLEETMIAVSQPLSPGTHHNITLQVKRSPPGGVVNRTALNTTSDYSVGLYRDTNNNSRFEYITFSSSTDGAYLVGSGTERRYASDAATITVPGSNTPTPTASIQFRDQTTSGSTVTVRSVTLPNGGFVVVHSGRYLRGGDPLQTIVGRSRHLSAGTHQNVTVRLNGSVQSGQTLVAIPSQDTNDNQNYDYIQSGGFRDVPYTGNNGVVTAQASVAGADSSSAPGPGTSTASPTTRTPGPDTTSQPPTTEATDSEGDVGSWIASNPLPVGIGVVVVLVVLPTLLKWVQW